MSNDVKTFGFYRYQYDRAAGKWKLLDNGLFSSRAKTPRGVAKAAASASPRVNRTTDIIMFNGSYFYDREHRVVGYWCPLLDRYEGIDVGSKEEMLRFLQERDRCMQYIVDYE